MSTVRIRPATEADAPEIADQYAGLHVDQWAGGGRPTRGDREPDWLGEVTHVLASPEARLFVAEVDVELIGTARVEFAQRPYFRIAEIRRVYVRPRWRRRGVATELMRVAEEAAREGGAREVRLSVVTANTEAIGFYRQRGYGDFALRLRKPT